MTTPEHIQRIERELTSSLDHRREGLSERALAALVQDRTLLRLARGWFVTAHAWNGWNPGARHLARVIVADRLAATPPLFSHHSAAVLLGLPVWNLGDEPVHVISTQSTRRTGRVVRHAYQVPASDTGTVGEFRCTSYQRTVMDLARVAPEETVLGCADAALRMLTRRGRTAGQTAVDTAAVDDWRSGMHERLLRIPNTPGVVMLRRVVAAADPRADSVLESVSRLQFDRLGVDVELQAAIPAPSGGFYYVDFRLVGLGVLGESDGESKYTDPDLLGDRTPAQAVLREKKRDNWITGRTGERMIHWGAREAATTKRFAEMLRNYNVPVPRRRGG